MRTRGMLALVSNRAASESITLTYNAYTDEYDGSSSLTETTVICKASVGVLQASDIQRLEKAGIIVQNGVTIVIPNTEELPPDTIYHNGKTYRVIDWSSHKEGNANTVVATCDEITLTAAV